MRWCQIQKVGRRNGPLIWRWPIQSETPKEPDLQATLEWRDIEAAPKDGTADFGRYYPIVRGGKPSADFYVNRWHSGLITELWRFICYGDVANGKYASPSQTILKKLNGM